MDNGNGDMVPPEQPESSRGAGGKMRKHPNRKPRTTPYARPPLNQSQTPLAIRSGSGGWLSKLVDPAYRLIGAGATRLLPSIFSRSPTVESPASSSSEDEENDKLQGEAEQENGDGKDIGSSDLPFIRSTQSANAESVKDESKGGFDARREDRSTHLPNAVGLLNIEQVIKGKTFTRDEVDRLMEVLRSRTVDLSTDEGKDKQAETNIIGVRGPATAPNLASKLNEEKQEVLERASKEVMTPLPKSNLRNEISASPVDIARAYMGRRMSKIGPSSVITAIDDDKALVHLDGYSSKPLIASPSHNSSIRWPGATVPDRYATPQTQRSRYGLHDFRRTPYSRTIYPMSKSKLIQVGEDGNKSLETESPLLKQFQTTMDRQVRSRSNILDGGCGSVGPVRRSRQKFAVGTPQKFLNFPPSASPSQRENTNLPSVSVPAYGKNMDAGGTGGCIKPLWTDDRPRSLEIGVPTVPTHSSQVARKILEHLDRNLPTPKEKSAELKLATSWKTPISSDAISAGGAAISPENLDKCGNGDVSNVHESSGASSFNLAPERSAIRIADAVGRKISVFHTNLRRSSPTNGSNTECANEISKLAPTAALTQPRDAVKKPPVPAAKAGLPSISIEKPERRPGLSSGNCSGFTFPVSASPALYPEPPTPSLMLPPSLGNIHHPPKEEASIPSFTFGANGSPPSLVFSFPSSSSSSAPVDATGDLKFTFGSAERRISFASTARGGVCC